MATSQPTLGPSNELTIRLRKPLRASLQEMAGLAAHKGTLDAYAQLLLENEIAGFRPYKFTRLPVLTPVGTMKIEIDDEGRRGRLSPQQVQQLLFLADTEKLNATALSKRFPISVTCVRRLPANRAECPRRVEPLARGRNHRQRGTPITLTRSARQEGQT